MLFFFLNNHEISKYTYYQLYPNHHKIEINSLEETTCLFIKRLKCTFSAIGINTKKIFRLTEDF